MEGDVSEILPRPTLPPNSPNPNDTSTSTTALSRYASKDLRARETQAEIEKWDAWHECRGMRRTEAKRKYISTLIDTMKVYAAGTPESRELISELEFVWSQIRSQSGSSEEGENNGGGSGGSGDGESPIRRLERAGLKPTESYGSIPPGRRRTATEDTITGGLRVLSPMSRGDPAEVVEGEEGDGEGEGDLPPAPEGEYDQNQPLDPSRTPSRHPPGTPSRTPRSTHSHASTFQSQTLLALANLRTELAALREQLDALSSSSSSSFHISRHRRGRGSILLAWTKWLIWIAARQVLINAVVLGLVVLWERLRGRGGGERRVEGWLWERWRVLWAEVERRRKARAAVVGDGVRGWLRIV